MGCNTCAASVSPPRFHHLCRAAEELKLARRNPPSWQFRISYWTAQKLTPEIQTDQRGRASQLILIAGIQTLVWLELKAHQSCAREVPGTLSRKQRGWLAGKAGLPLQSWFSCADRRRTVSCCSLGI